MTIAKCRKDLHLAFLLLLAGSWLLHETISQNWRLRVYLSNQTWSLPAQCDTFIEMHFKIQGPSCGKPVGKYFGVLSTALFNHSSIFLFNCPEIDISVTCGSLRDKSLCHIIIILLMVLFRSRRTSAFGLKCGGDKC